MAEASRFIALVTGCAGLAVSMLSCSQAPSDSQAGQETTIRQQEATWLKAIGNKQLDATVSYYGGGAFLWVAAGLDDRTEDDRDDSYASDGEDGYAGAAISRA